LSVPCRAVPLGTAARRAHAMEGTTSKDKKNQKSITHKSRIEENPSLIIKFID
jgi:hypothetical protein